MDTLTIKRDELTTVATVKIGAETTLTYQLMGEHKVQAQFVSAAPIPFVLGDYIEIGVEKYYLNILPQVVKVNNITYRYSAAFESELYRLFNKQFMDEGAAEFTYFGTPSGYIQLLIDNMNEIDPGWTMDVVADLNPISISFKGESCRQALGRICEAFGVEFRLVQREIIVRKDVGFSSLYLFEYGRNNGLYSLTRSSLVEKGVITRLYAFGGEKNLSSDYRSGAKRLVFETGDPAKSYLEANVANFGIKEGSVTFDDIYPQRTGSVSATADMNTVTDASLDFDINDYLLTTLDAKIVFKTGALAGQEFKIKSYDHASKTIVFYSNSEANGDTFPKAPSFIPEVGDEYTLVNIKMPQSYIDAAEEELLTAATEYLDTVKTPRVTYTLEINEKYIRKNNVEIACGMRVTVKDDNLGLDDLIRIYAIQYPLVNPSRITAQIADSIPASVIDRLVKDNSKGKTDIINIERSQAELYRDSINRFRDFFSNYFDADGQFDGTHIKPGTVETGAVAVGTKSQNFGLNNVEIEANFEGDPNRLRISGGQLVHFEIEIEGLGYTWNIDPAVFNTLVPGNLYYVYARCNKSALSGTWKVSVNRILAEEEAGWYHFWLGMLYPVDNGKRYFMFTKGMTFIIGDTITTGRIQDLSGLNFFDLTQGVFNLGDEENGMDWGVSEPNKLTIRGAVIANAIFANEGLIENLRVSSLKTANSGKRLEILADDGGDPATPLHNLKFYDADGNLALTLDTAVDSGSTTNASAGIKIEKNGSNRKGLFTQNGMLSEGSYLTSDALPTNHHLASILGILKEKFFSIAGIRAGVIGYDATAAETMESYGGWFNTSHAGGLSIATKQVTTNYTCTKDDTFISCYNASAITVSLPLNPYKDKVMIIRRNNGDVNISGNGRNIRVTGLVSAKGMGASNGQGDCAFLVYDGTAWTFNRWKL